MGRARHGMCNGCGMLTISDAQRNRLHKAMRKYSDVFDLGPMYLEADGKKQAPLWKQATIVAKGVAEHVKPWSRGGATDASNLTNCCSCCNYTRGDTDLSAMGAPAYNRPDTETHVTPSDAPSSTTFLG
jgi:HNH endonuclease